VSDFRQPERNKETTMTNRKNLAGESGYSSPFTLTIVAIAICGSLVFGAAAMAPAAADDSTATYAIADNGPTGDFPAQFVNRGTEIELMMEMCD
jgi:hypothetical protein